jgi:hypothetical protein
MAIDALQTVEMIELLENFVARLRPADEAVRKKLDYGYNIDDQRVILFEIRPDWIKPEIIREHPFAKATYVKKYGVWKIYWLRANLKWYPYDPCPRVYSLKKFLDIVVKDDQGCFFG